MNIVLEDLQINNYMIYQDKDSFNFGIDAVLLANFALNQYGIAKCIGASQDNPLKVCDLCAGNLPIPLIMYAKREKYLSKFVKFKAFEINESQCALSEKSLKFNSENTADAKNILDDIKIVNDDLKNIYLDKDKYKDMYETYDIITCNPPYIKKGSGIVNDKEEKIIARHEVSITFDEICKASNMILKSNKSFFLIHHSDRFTEISSTLKKNSFEIKKAKFIYPYIDKMSNLVLIEAVKNANEGIKILPPEVVYSA